MIHCIYQNKEKDFLILSLSLSPFHFLVFLSHCYTYSTKIRCILREENCVLSFGVFKDRTDSLIVSVEKEMSSEEYLSRKQ